MSANLGIRIGVEGTAQAETALRGMATGMQQLGSATEKTRAEMQAAKSVFENWDKNNTSFGNLNKQIQLTGMTAKETANALRGIPMQMTDIFTSLGSGQSPFTVLLQQGGQLKDQFRGVGNAVQAVGGYVAGFVTPLNLVAAAAAGVGLAIFNAEQQVSEFSKTILLTGNAVGASVDQLATIASAIGSGYGATVGKASDAVNALAKTGQVGASSLKNFADVAIQAERAFGISVEEIAKNFAELGKDPVAASSRLNESMNFLTASTYEQIKAAKAQGDETKAAALAQDAYANALKSRSQDMVQSLGYVGKAWMVIADVSKQALDNILNWGGPKTIEKQMQELAGKINRGFRLPGEDVDQMIAKYRELGRLRDEQNAKAAKAAEDAKTNKAAIAAIDDVSKANTAALTKTEQMNKALGDYRESIEKIRKADPNSALLNPAQIAKTEAAIRDQYKESDKAATVYEQLTKRVSDFAAMQEAAGDGQEKLTEGQKLAIKVAEDLAAAGKKITEAEKMRIMQAVQGVLVREQQIELEKQEIALLKESAQENFKTAEALYKKNASLDEEIKKQREAIDAMGLGKEALAKLEAARLDDAAAQAARNEQFARETLLNDALADQYANQAEKLRELAGLKRAGGAKEQGLESAKAATSEFDKLIGQINQAKLNNIFAPLTDGAFRFIGALQAVIDLEDKAEKARAANRVTNAGDPAAMAKEQARIQEESAKASVSAYATMTGALRGYAKEGTKTYQALLTAEKVFRAFELASAIQNAATKMGLLTAFTGAKIASDTTLTTSATAGAATEIAATTAVGQAKAMAGIANQSGGDPYTAFPRMATMAAIMAGLGFIVSMRGGSSAPPTNQGTGTVFGSSTARSESFSKSLDILNRTQDEALLYSKAMAASLRSIESALGGFTNIYLRTGGTSGLTSTIATGTFDTGLSSFLSTGNGLLGKVGDFFSSVNRALFGKKVSITGSGISASDQTLGDVLGKGFEGKYYADVKTSRKAFGITYSSSTSTRTSDLDPALERQITAIFNGVNDSVTIAAELLGQNMQTVEQSLKDYVVKIGRVDLQGLDGKAIAEKLSAVFGAEADKIALSVIPGFERLQKVGEGYFETLTRVANEFETVNIYMARLGDRLGDIGIAGATAADALVQAFGGLDQYTSAIGDYYKTYYTEAERNARTATELGAAFSKLNVSAPKTLQGFRDLVNAQDLTTEAGRNTYAALIQLAPAFAQVTNAAEEASKAAAESAKAAARQATDDAYAALQRSVDAQRKTVEATRQIAQEQVSAIKSVFGVLDAGIKNLLGNTSGAVERANQFIDNALSTARATGYLPDSQALQDAISTATQGLGSEIYGSAADQQAARLQLAGKLGDLKEISGDQLTTAEKQLKAAQDQLDNLDQILQTAKDQIDVLRGIDIGIKSIPDALQTLKDAIIAEKSSASKAVQTSASAAAQSDAGSALLSSVSKYAEKNGGNAYYFIKGVNDLEAKQANAAEIARLTGMTAEQAMLLATGKTAQEWQKIESDFYKGLAPKAYANGGYYPGGLALVGEQGPELINFKDPGQVYTAAQTQSILSGGPRVEALIADLTAEVRRLQSIVNDGNREARRTADAVNGNPEQPMLVQTA